MVLHAARQREVQKSDQEMCTNRAGLAKSGCHDRELMKFAERCIGYLLSPIINRITDVDRELGDARKLPVGPLQQGSKWGYSTMEMVRQTRS
jgi:hypothetical protein